MWLPVCRGPQLPLPVNLAVIPSSGTNKWLHPITERTKLTQTQRTSHPARPALDQALSWIMWLLWQFMTWDCKRIQSNKQARWQQRLRGNTRDTFGDFLLCFAVILHRRPQIGLFEVLNRRRRRSRRRGRAPTYFLSVFFNRAMILIMNFHDIGTM